MWLASSKGGLFQYNGNTLMNRFTHDPKNPASLASDTIITISADSYGNIWLGTLGKGLEQFVKSKNEFIHHSHHPDDEGSLSSNGVIYIYEDRKRNLWAGTLKPELIEP
jgi:ligand-binding sensor domain-containing protein